MQERTKGQPYRVTIYYRSGRVEHGDWRTLKRADFSAWATAKSNHWTIAKTELRDMRKPDHVLKVWDNGPIS